MNIDYTETSKEYELLCQTIANTVLVKSEQGLMFFLWIPSLNDNQIMRTTIFNATNISNILLRNQRTLKIIMKTRNMWKFVFTSWIELLRSDKLMDHEHLIRNEVFQLTLPYWKFEHIVYALKCGFLNALAYAFNTAYNHSDKRRKNNVKCFVVEVITTMWMINIDLKINYDYIANFISDYLKHPSLFKPNKKIKKKQQQNYYHHVDHVIHAFRKFLLQKQIPKSLAQIGFIQEKKNAMIKVCGNKKCKKSRRTHPEFKFKICKGCRIFYTCNRKCQKIAWNDYHGEQCKKLQKQLLFVNF